MRVSYQMERYAQRAVDERRRNDANQAIGKFLVIQYLAQGEHLCEALKDMSQMERQKYISKHTELLESSDGVEGINIVWCPGRQVITHRLLSAELRAEFDGAHYLSTWVRRVGPHQHDDLRAMLRERLEKRVVQRHAQKNQLALPLSSAQAS